MGIVEADSRAGAKPLTRLLSCQVLELWRSHARASYPQGSKPSK